MILKVPAAIGVETLFPCLDTRHSTNMPLCASPALVKQFPPLNNGQPVSIHPHLENSAHSSDCVMVEDWHTAFLNPRNYVDWLVGLKEKTPTDTVWYAPASGLPSNVHIMLFADLFDFKALISNCPDAILCARSSLYTPGSESAVAARENLKMHNRQSLLCEIACCGSLGSCDVIWCPAGRNQVAIMRQRDNQYGFMERHACCTGGVAR
jgi:archaeosine synthase